jgi:hypothetical protein
MIADKKSVNQFASLSFLSGLFLRAQWRTRARERCRSLLLSQAQRRSENRRRGVRVDHADAQRSECHERAGLNAPACVHQPCRRCCKNLCLPARLPRLPGNPRPRQSERDVCHLNSLQFSSLMPSSIVWLRSINTISFCVRQTSVCRYFRRFRRLSRQTEVCRTIKLLAPK